ncbi:hypothetical protein FFK22_022490 [Mycobacterium sp. KBS0706]|uniref:hypothetical protein n=1 Tax=Mycobacterium sp. KBS0706 TaxID=2578109 RepID=UPI00110FF39B|nr:hypothetical protein [Mycobacterium sp. KBS0706]TSD86389.1 hypothetical protein FFK22_022490 [Mycobacterium sp. KBS0706]
MLHLDRADAVPGKANLLESLLGGSVEVAVRRELLGASASGAHMRCRAKRTPDGAMCEAHPAPGNFEVSQ